MIITITGKPGSGKSTVAKVIAKKLNYSFFSTGDFRGEVAQKHGLTIDELNEIGKKEFWTDKKVDDKVKLIGKTKDNFIIDTWLGFYFIPHAIKIFLDVDLNIAAKRIFIDQRKDEEKKETVNQVKEMLEKRLKETQDRFKKYYKVDFLDKKHYDKIINTTNLSKYQIINKILEFVKKEKK
jgi:CMP/dCMP kinase